MKYWHCFQVNDYKGGELHSEINLSAQDLLSIISKESYNVIIDFTEEELKEFLTSDKDLVRVFDDWYEGECADNGEYAGYSGVTTYEIYYSDSEGILNDGFPSDEEIASFMRNLITEYIDNYQN